MRRKFTGFDAVRIQHELDHLNGFLIKDRLLRPSLVGVAKKTTPKTEKSEEKQEK